jgi:protein phosphatase
MESDRRDRTDGETNILGPGSNRVFVNAYGQSDAGTRRRHNQDQFLVAALNRQLEVFQTSLGRQGPLGLDEPAQHGWVFLVADGMGVRADGEEASAVTAKASLEYLQTTMPWFAVLEAEQLDRAEEVLRSVVRSCHRAVESADRRRRRPGTMASTLTLAYVLWPHLFVVHTGDSRCYLLRDGTLRQVTRDHTLAQKMLDTGALDADQADDSSLDRVLTKAVGGSRRDPPEPSVVREQLTDRDALLLCTDGLTSMVADDRIAELLCRETFANARCQALVEAANEAGGEDNITVVVASFDDFDAREGTRS